MAASKLSRIVRPGKIDCSVVVVAAGASERFGADKLMADLAGIPVLARSIALFEDCPYVREIVVVSSEERIGEIAALCQEHKLSKVSSVVLGGETRLHSALSGVSECRPQAGLIAIHDGARPLASPELIREVIECAHRHRAAVPALRSKETIKLARGRRVSQTPDRASAFAVQTPQVFDPIIIKGALTDAITKKLRVYDDASAVEALGFAVYLSKGSEQNIKITTPLDMEIAELIISLREHEREPLGESV
jgi:2-C-methyl-D-erythritol 4-phosphate cytidylyltransferase